MAAEPALEGGGVDVEGLAPIGRVADRRIAIFGPKCLPRARSGGRWTSRRDELRGVCEFGQALDERRGEQLTGTTTITGLAFFDVIHGQRGVAPNGIELHPVLSFKVAALRWPPCDAPPLNPTPAESIARATGEAGSQLSPPRRRTAARSPKAVLEPPLERSIMLAM